MKNSSLLELQLGNKVSFQSSILLQKLGHLVRPLQKGSTLLLLFILLSYSGFAATWFSQGSSDPSVLTNWNSASNGSGSAPASFTSSATDVWTIQSAMTCAHDWTVAGSILISSGSLSAGSFTITVGNNWTNSATFTCGTGTVIFNATSSGHTLSGTLNTASGRFYNLTFNGSGGAWTMGANTTTVLNTLSISAGTLTAPSSTLNIGGDFSCAGTFTHNSGTVNFNGGGAQSLPSASISYQNFSTAGSGTNLSANGTIVINNNLTIAANTTLNMGANTMTTITSAGITNNGTVQTSATSTAFPNNLNWASNSGTGTVFYAAAGNQSVMTGTYYNLKVGNGANSYTASGASSTTVNGTLTINAGSTYDLSGSQLLAGASFATSINSSASLSTAFATNPSIPSGYSWGGTVIGAGSGNVFIPAGTYNNVSFTGSTGGKNLYAATLSGNLVINLANPSSGNVSLQGDITVNGSISLTGQKVSTFDCNAHSINLKGDFTFFCGSNVLLFNAGTQLVTLSGTGAQAISATGSSALPNFYDLKNSNTTGIVTISDNTTIGNNLTNDPSATLNLGSTSILIGGNYTNSGLVNSGTSTITMNAGSGSHTLSGNMTGTSKLNNLVFSTAFAWSFGANAADIGGNFIIANGTAAVTAPSTTLRVAQTFSVTGTGTRFIHNSGTVELNGTSGQSLIAGAVIAFNNLNVTNPSGVVTSSTPISVAAALTGASNCDFNMGANAFTGSPTVSSYFGIFETQYSSGTAIAAGLSWGTGSTVKFNSTTGNMTVAQGTYYNLTITGTSGTRLFGAGTTTVNNNLVVGNSSTTGLTSLNGNLVVGGSVTITSSTGTIFDVTSSNYSISVGGDWTQSSSDATNPFNPRSGLVTLTGAAAAIQTLSVSGGTGTPTFYDLTDNNTSFAFNVNASTAISHIFSVSPSALVTPLAAVVINPGGAGTSTLQGSGTIQITRIGATPTLNGQYVFNTRTLTSMTADYAGAGNQNVNVFTYGTLKTSNSGTKTANGDLSINNGLNVGLGTTLDMSSYLLSTSGSPTYTVNGTLMTSVPSTTSTTPIPAGATWNGTGTVEYALSTGHQRMVSGTFYNLTTDNATGSDTLSGTITVNGTLTPGGLVFLLTNNINLSSTASISGYSESSYIVASQSGKLRRNFTANGTFFYPIGGPVNYTPVSLTITGSAYSSAYVEVNETWSKHPNNGSTTDYLNRYWTIVQSGITGGTYDATITYAVGDKRGTEASIRGAKYIGALPWVRYGFVNTADNTFDVTGVTQASADFTGMTGNNPSATFSPTNPTICSSNSVGITATGVGDPSFTYSWAPSTGLNVTTGVSVTASPTVTTVYTVTITDGNGLTGTSTNTVTVNPSPTSTGATNNGPVCAGSTGTLSSNSTNATIWSWTGPSGFTSTLQNPTITPTVTGTYSVSISNSGCSNSTVFTTTVTVNPLPISSGATNNGPICNGGTVTLSANSTNATIWSWVGSDGFTSTLQNPTATPTSNTTYSLTVRSASCTPATVYTTTVTVISAPSLTSASNNGTICAGATLNLTANSPSNVTSYLWNGPVAITSSTSASASVPSATTAASGTYTVTVNNGSGSGCSVKYTTTTTVNAAPSLTSASNNGPICAGATLNLTANGASNVTAYLWNGPVAITNSTSASASVPSASIASSGTYTVTVNNGSGTGCAVQYTTAATVNAVPSSSGITSNSPVTAGNSVNLTSNSNSSTTLWSWTGPSGYTSTAQNPSFIASVSGTFVYTLSVSGTGSGCSPATTYTASVTVNPYVGNWYSQGTSDPSVAGNWNSQSDGSGIVAVASDFVDAGNTWNVQAALTATSSWTIAGNLNLPGGQSITDGGNAISIGGNITGAGSESGTGGITMTGSGASISGITIGNLTLNNSGGFTITGHLIISGGSLNFNNGKLSLNNNLLSFGNSTINGMSASKCFVGSASSSISISGSLATPGTIYFDQTTPGTTNLLSSFAINCNGRVVTLGNNMVVSTTLNLTTGQLADGGNTITNQGNIVGSIGIESGSGKILMTGSSKNISANLNNVELSNASVFGLATNTVINGTITFTSGSLAIGSHTLTVNGAVSGMGTSNYLSGGASSSLTIGSTSSIGTLFFDQTTPGTSNNINTLTFSSSGGRAIVGNALNVSNVLSIATGATLDMATALLTETGSPTNTVNGTLKTSVPTATSSTPIPSGTTWGGSGKVEYALTTGAQTVVGNTYYSLLLDNTSGTNTAGGDLTVNTNFTLSSGGTLDMVTYQLSGSFTPLGIGTINTQNTGSTPIPSGNTWVNSGLTKNISIVYNGTGNQTIVTGTFKDITISGARLSTPTLTLASGTVFVQGVLNAAYTGAVNFSTTGNTVEYNYNFGSFPGAVASLNYNNLTIGATNATPSAGTANYGLSGNTSVDGTLLLTSNLAIQANTLTLNGTASGAGKLLGSASSDLTIAAAGAVGTLSLDQTTPGTTNNIRNFTLNTSGGSVTMGAILNISNQLSNATGCTLNMGSNQLTGAPSSISNSGILTTNSTSSPAIPSGYTWGGTVEYASLSGSQTLVTGTYNNLKLDNTSGTNSIGSAITINGTLTLGNLTLGSNSLTLGSSATISGASSTNMVVATGSGKLIKQYTGSGSFNYPVGDNLGPNYTPVNLTFGAGTYSSASAGINLAGSKEPHNANTTNFLNRYWTVSTTGTIPAYDINVTYVPGDVTGTEATLAMGKFASSLPFVKFGTTNTSTHTLSATGITSATANFTGINNTSPTVSLVTGSSTFCIGSSTTLTASGIGDATFNYTWAPSTGLSATTGASVTASPTVAATFVYTVTATDGNGFTAINTSTVTVSPVPTLTSASNDGPICAGTTLNLSANGASNVTGYSWAGPVAITTPTSASASVPSATTGATGTYTVTVNNGSGTGCTARYTTAATVSPVPSLTSANNDGPICAGTTLNLSVTGASNVTGYLWNGPVAITSSTSASASVPSATIGANGTYTVTVNNGSGTGCTAKYTTAATVSPVPSLTSANNDGPICAGTTLNLSVTGASNITGYLWNGPVAITSSTSASASVPSATTSANGTYTVTVNNGSGTGCTARYTTAATVSPAPSLTSANNDGPICAGTTLNLTVTGASNVTGYLWNGPVAITNSTSASASVPSATTGATGTYTVTVNNGSGTGCTARYTTAATVSPVPTLTSATNDGPICAGNTLHLTANGASNVTGYSWAGPVAITTPTSASASVPTATIGATGTYTVTVNNGSGTGCTARYTTAATVSTAPSLTSANNDGPICAGTTLNLTVSGASNVTSYSWAGPVAITNSTSSSASVPSATTAASGVYTVTVTGLGCSLSYTTSATVSPVPSLTSANNDGPICAGTTLNLSVTGASNVTGYLWNGPVAITTSTSASASVPSATTGASGTYTVTVNNGSGTGCTAQYTTAATVSPVPALTSATNDGPICAGTTLNLSANGASNVTGYIWNGPVAITSSTSASASVPSATTSANGTYTVTVNNGSGTGCTARYTTAATVSPVPSLTSANNDGPICAGTTLHLTVTGASNVTGYLWNGPIAITTSTSASASVPSATTGATGTYTVTVNNGSGTGCTAQYTTAATVSPVPTLTSASNDGPICAGTTLNLSANGASNVTGYSWAGPVAITTPTSASASVPSATTGATGTYTVTINNGSGTGCTAQYTTAATVSPVPSLTSANNDGPICALSTLHLTVTGASNVTGYLWNGPVAITNSTSAAASVPSASTGATGTYTVTVNNGSGTGCTAQYTTSATISPSPTLTSANNDGPICAGTTLNLTVSGASNVTGYVWNGPVAITSSTSASASVPSATTSASGVYTVTVSGLGCSAQYTTAATVSPVPTLTSANNDGPICAGTTLNLTVGGASNVTGYLWNGPVAITNSTSASASVPSATTGATGTYTVTVNNGTGTGCTAQYTTAATVSPVPTLTSANNDGPICAGTTLHLTVSGASNVTGYSWSGPVSITTPTSASASVPSASTGANGTYTVTVNNGSGTGCTAQYTTAATVSPVPALTSANNDGPICAGTTLNLTVAGASNVTGYLWNGPVAITNSTSASASVPSATTGANGTYTVTVNNGSGTGCTAQYTTAATVSPVPTLTSANNDGPICAGTTLNLTVTGASNVTGYSWAGPVSITTPTSASASVPSATTGATGTYTVTVNNGSGTGCTAQYTTAATVSPVPTLTSANNDGPICAGTTLNLSVTGASNVTGYLWNGPVAITNSTSASASVPSSTTSANGTYTVTVNNGSGTGCTARYTTAATVSPVPTLTSANNDGPICAGTTLHLTVSGAANVTGYLWNGPVAISTSTSASASVPSATTSADGTYTVTVNNGSGTGCTAQYTTTATVSPVPTLTSASNDGPVCVGGTLNLTANGAANVTGYLWNGPVAITNSTSSAASVSSVTLGAAGTYTVTVNNGSGTGCTANYTTTPTINPAPSLTSANNNGPFCSGTTLLLTVSGASNVTGYLWNGPVAITSSTSASASVPGATPVAAGVYTVTVNNGSGSGCAVPYTTTAVISPIPSITSADNNGPICAGATLNLTVTSPVNVTGYSWSGPAAITNASTASASVPSAATSASGIYSVTVSSGAGCANTYTTSVTVNTLPVAAPSNSGAVCQDNPVNLFANPSGGANTFSWSGPNLSSTTAQNPVATPSVTTVYSLTVTNGTGNPGCSPATVYTTTVIIYPKPGPITGSTSVCAGSSTNLSNSVSGGLWTSSMPGVATINCNLGIIDGISVGSSIISYTLPTGCFTTTTVSVISLAAITGASVLCTGSNTTLSDATAGGQWVSGNGSVATIGSGTGVVTGIAPGNVMISYLYGSGCMVTSFLTVLSIPANTGATSVCVGGTATVINATEGGTWTSSNTSAATIAPSTGLVTGIASGSTIITYSFGSACISTNTVTVNDLPGTVSVTGGGTFCGSATIAATGGTGGTIYFQGTTSGGTSTATASSRENVTTSGSYYFRSMSTSGCWGPEGSVTVVVPAITGPLTICTGTTATLGNSGGTSTWTSSNTTVAIIDTNTGYISALTPGNTTITSTTSSGCVVTANVTVGVAPAITGPASVCAGQSITLANSGLGGVWSSGSPTIATVTSTGIVTGIASYLPATISYTFNSGCVATYVVTVNPLSAISVPSFVCAGQTITLSNSVSGGVWSSASAGIASIGSGSGIVTGVNSGSALISYVMPTGCVTTAPVLVKVLSATSGPTSVCAGQSITLSNTTPGGTWTSSSPTIATINSVNGVTTGVAGISVTLSAPISYSLGSGCIAVYNVTVNPLPAITGTTNICQGLTTTLYNPQPGGTWTSANASIATISSGGLASGVGSGIVTISYQLPTGCLTTIPLNVNPVAPIQGSNVVCQGQTITLVDTAGAGTWSTSAPTIATVGSLGVVTGIAPHHTVDITYTFCTGCTTQITLTVTAISAIDVTGPICQGDITTLTNTGSGGVWTSSAPAVAFFGSTNGNITGVAAGTTTVTYSIGSACFAYATVTVNPLAAIVGANSVCNGATITLTDATFGGTWSSSTPSVASVGASTGIVTGNAGSNVATISYTTPTGCKAYKTVTVNPLNPITGPSTVCLGLTVTLANSTPGGGTWVSATPGIASVVAATGVVTGVAQGTATVSFVSSLGCINTTVITVNNNGPISGTASVCVGQSVTLTNTNVGGTWSTPNPTMITVGSSSGMVTGLVGGTFPIVTYTQTGGCRVAYTMTVNALASITGPTTVCPGQTITAGYLPTGPNWSSSATGVATIGTTGIITGVAAGTTTISYTNANGCIATEVVTVATGSPITGPTSVCNGQSITLANSIIGGTWSTSSPTMVNVGSASGVVTGLAGSTFPTISYTSTSGCVSTYVVTVNALSSITGSTSVCQSQTITLSYLPVGTGWSSSTPGVASITTGGVVTGVTTGTSTISYTTSNGCITTRVVAVVTGSPIAGASTVCNTQSVTLTNATAGGLWTTSNPSLATVGSISGIVTGMAGGTFPIISYTTGGGCVSTYAMTVNALSSITGLGPVCQSQTITASYLPVGTGWSSSTPGVATIASTGVITGVAAGTATISFTTSNGCVATGIVSVNPFSTISGPATVCKGQSVTLTPGTAGGTWSTAYVSLATVGAATGVVTGVAGGTFPIISYTLPGGCRSTYSMTVNALGSISMATSVCQLSTTLASYTTGTGTWSTSASGIASIGTTGTVTGVAGGTATISYTLTNGCIATTPILVNPISNIAGPTSVCKFNTITLTDATPGGSWSTPAGIVSVVASSGVVTGLLGTYLTSVSYTMPSGCKVGYAVTVNALPTAPGSITGPSTVSVSGATITLGCTPSGGTWSSSNAAKATVNPATGVVTGVGTGSAIITYTVSNVSGCTNYNTKVITVGPMPPPHAATNNTITIGLGNTITLQEAIAGGTWNLLSGDDIISIDNATGKVTGIASGRALVDYEVYDEQGNHTNITEVIVTPSSLTVNGINESGNVMIMPNPNSGTFTVKGSLATLTTGDAFIEVVNMLGQTVYITKVALKDGSINEQVILGSALANGRYILNLRNGEEKHTFRFVLER